MPAVSYNGLLKIYPQLNNNTEIGTHSLSVNQLHVKVVFIIIVYCMCPIVCQKEHISVLVLMKGHLRFTDGLLGNTSTAGSLYFTSVQQMALCSDGSVSFPVSMCTVMPVCLVVMSPLLPRDPFWAVMTRTSRSHVFPRSRVTALSLRWCRIAPLHYTTPQRLPTYLREIRWPAKSPVPLSRPRHHGAM